MVRRTRSDLMSYCPLRWISDYHVANGLRFRLGDADSAGLPYLGRQKSLLLWGGVDTDGLPFLEPGLVLETPRPRSPAPAASTISQVEPAAAPSCSP